MDPVHESQGAEIDRWIHMVLIVLSSRERMREVKARMLGGANEQSNEEESYACEYVNGLVELVEDSKGEDIGDDAGEYMLDWARVEEHECGWGWIGVMSFMNAGIEAGMMHGAMNIVYEHLVS